MKRIKVFATTSYGVTQEIGEMHNKEDRDRIFAENSMSRVYFEYQIFSPNSQEWEWASYSEVMDLLDPQGSLES